MPPAVEHHQPNFEFGVGFTTAEEAKTSPKDNKQLGVEQEINSLSNGLPDLTTSMCSTPAKEEPDDDLPKTKAINPFQFSAGKSGFEAEPEHLPVNNYYAPVEAEMSSRM